MIHILIVSLATPQEMPYAIAKVIIYGLVLIQRFVAYRRKTMLRNGD